MGIFQALSNRLNSRKYFEAPDKAYHTYYYKEWKVEEDNGLFRFYHPTKRKGYVEISFLHNDHDRHFNFIESQMEKYKEFKPRRFNKGDQHHLVVQKHVETEKGLAMADIFIVSTIKGLIIGSYNMPPKKDWGKDHQEILKERKEAQRMFKVMELK